MHHEWAVVKREQRTDSLQNAIKLLFVAVGLILYDYSALALRVLH
jgi:hypothetical protein